MKQQTTTKTQDASHKTTQDTYQTPQEKPEYTPEMQAYNRIRLLKRIARQIGYRLTIPINPKPIEIEKAATELSTLIMEE